MILLLILTILALSLSVWNLFRDPMDDLAFLSAFTSLVAVIFVIAWIAT